jgi:hypothetical protein
MTPTDNRRDSRSPRVPADPRTASAILSSCYDDGAGAGAEALLRALICERACDREGAEFWTEVYVLIVERIGRLDTADER